MHHQSITEHSSDYISGDRQKLLVVQDDSEGAGLTFWEFCSCPGGWRDSHSGDTLWAVIDGATGRYLAEWSMQVWTYTLTTLYFMCEKYISADFRSQSVSLS